MIIHELRSHLFDNLKVIFASDIAANQLEIVFGVNEMLSVDSVRLGNSSTLRSQAHALGYKQGLFQAEVDLMLIVDIQSRFDPMEAESRANEIANKIIYAFALDCERPESLHAIQGCTAVEVEFLTTETDQLGDGLMSSVVISFIWKGEVFDADLV